MEVGEIAPLPQSLDSGTPLSCCSFEDFAGCDFTLQSPARDDHTSWFEIEKHEALRELQQMVNRYNDCFRILKDAVTAVELLRQENLQLAAEHMELELLMNENERMEREKMSPAGGGAPKFETKGGIKIGRWRNGLDLDSPGGYGSGSGSGFESGVESGSGSGSGSGSDGARAGGVPKSISIRSRGYSAVSQPPAGRAHRLRLPVSPALNEGGDKESGEVEVEVEVDVYNQGTAKTELCNKWGQTGWCPYADRCRFAHGMEELRPVIRHPRYKTQLCRMMGSGGDCPYGHRCHFRHALPKTDY